VTSIELSRPAALAARLADIDPAEAMHLFTTRHVVVRLEPELGGNALAHGSLVLAANQILRFCPNVTFALPEDARSPLEPKLRRLAEAIHATPNLAFARAPVSADATLTIGNEIDAGPDSIAINGDGWLSRMTTSAAEPDGLPPGFTGSNPIGGLGAACLGAGQIFTALIGQPLRSTPIEISLFTLEQSLPGHLEQTPEIMLSDVALDVLLVGCGGVANGWVYAAREARTAGRVEAVDHQAQRPENLGPYVCATRDRIGTPKAKIVEAELGSRMHVISRPERFRFFKARLAYEQTYLPTIVLSALDNAPVRRDLQRLWAPITVDLAAEELTSQLIVKNLTDGGQCLLEAYTDPRGDDAELAALAEATGLTVERLRDFETPITEADVAAAPPEKRAALEHARRRGQLVCGRIGDVDLHEEEYALTFTPAVPFVTCFTGVLAYAQTVRARIEPLASLHFQFNFRSYRSRVLKLRCPSGCECSTIRNAVMDEAS
jgi:hypothetical protein